MCVSPQDLLVQVLGILLKSKLLVSANLRSIYPASPGLGLGFGLELAAREGSPGCGEVFVGLRVAA